MTETDALLSQDQRAAVVRTRVDECVAHRIDDGLFDGQGVAGGDQARDAHIQRRVEMHRAVKPLPRSLPWG